MATFSKTEINEMHVDMNDEWEYTEAGHCSVMITVGDSLYEKFRGWFGISEEEWETNDYYLDIFADFNTQHATVDTIYVVIGGLYINDEANRPTELEFWITNQPERRLLYNTLQKSGGTEFIKFLHNAVA